MFPSRGQPGACERVPRRHWPDRGESPRASPQQRCSPRFPLQVRARAKTIFSIAPAKSENVIGMLPGATKEAIILSAHLDHLGVGGAINGDPIYNGAMDNASGIATLIETAKAWRAKGSNGRYSLPLSQEKKVG